MSALCCLLPITLRIYLSVANLQPNYAPSHTLQSPFQGTNSDGPRPASPPPARVQAPASLDAGIKRLHASRDFGRRPPHANSSRLAYLGRAVSGSGPWYL